METQWYEILRKDGKKQYALKMGEDYFLYGSGFAIRNFDAVSVTPIEEIPREIVHGKAFFEDGPKFRACRNKNEYWNGWIKPYLHISQLKKFIKYMSMDDNLTFSIKDGILTIDRKDGEDSSIIEPEVIDDDLYYDLGGEGYCWEFRKN